MKTPTVPTGSFRELVQSRIERDSTFAAELLHEGLAAPGSLTEAILETANGMKRVGVLDDDIHAKITARHRGQSTSVVLAYERDMSEGN